MAKIKVISLGGSLVNPDEIDIRFLKKFQKFILELIKEFYFLIVVGGGELARQYQKGLRKLGKKDQITLDWIGIEATKLNAKLVQLIFRSKSSDQILTKLNQKIDFQGKRIIVGAGTEPGWSTDYDAFWWANSLGIKTIINATNIDYVYDRPPEKLGAKPLEKISWEDYLKIIGKKWQAGKNFPIDPVAAQFAKKHKMKAFLVEGNNFPELKKAISNQPFKGTILS